MSTPENSNEFTLAHLAVALTQYHFAVHKTHTTQQYLADIFVIWFCYQIRFQLTLILWFVFLFVCSFFYSILVGAPLGQNLQPKTNRSGALFKCPISSDQDDCTQVITDGRRCKSFSIEVEKNARGFDWKYSLYRPFLAKVYFLAKWIDAFSVPVESKSDFFFQNQKQWINKVKRVNHTNQVRSRVRLLLENSQN